MMWYLVGNFCDPSLWHGVTETWRQHKHKTGMEHTDDIVNRIIRRELPSHLSESPMLIAYASGCTDRHCNGFLCHRRHDNLPSLSE